MDMSHDPLKSCNSPIFLVTWLPMFSETILHISIHHISKTSNYEPHRNPVQEGAPMLGFYRINMGVGALFLSEMP